jgi:hypothetical protein
MFCTTTGRIPDGWFAQLCLFIQSPAVEAGGLLMKTEAMQGRQHLIKTRGGFIVHDDGGTAVRGLKKKGHPKTCLSWPPTRERNLQLAIPELP